VSGEEALLLLLDYYRLTEVLSRLFHAEVIGQFSSRIGTLVQPFVQNDRTFSILAPASDYPGSQNRRDNYTSETGHEKGTLKATIMEAMDAFNPHFIAGACGFFHNVFLAYPKLIDKYLQNGSLINHLIR